ncbi:hypothetical protein MSG28_013787 [Choristoneura fumiferana]|uniref:Uncharacterized protein n=1 Tax=Choristoneura fumiferana TaxID=7141 RepID=A0ACC0K8R8_CHOFU|nr:hypothetical protein MSG28_013787 [Choristoneura fumiferana]
MSHHKVADSSGKLFVIGSGHFFADQYLECECNDLIRERVFDHLAGVNDLHLNPVDVEDPDVSSLRPLLAWYNTWHYRKGDGWPAKKEVPVLELVELDSSFFPLLSWYNS